MPDTPLPDAHEVASGAQVADFLLQEEIDPAAQAEQALQDRTQRLIIAGQSLANAALRQKCLTTLKIYPDSKLVTSRRLGDILRPMGKPIPSWEICSYVPAFHSMWEGPQAEQEGLALGKDGLLRTFMTDRWSHTSIMRRSLRSPADRLKISHEDIASSLAAFAVKNRLYVPA